MSGTIPRERDTSAQKKAAESYKLSIEDFCSVYLPDHKLRKIVVFLQASSMYPYCVYFLVRNIHLLVPIICYTTHNDNLLFSYSQI